MYTIKLEQFSGPFDILLRLIEKEKLDITDISLATVTNKFVAHINKLDEISPKELADFLEIAAKLILLKSRLLLPKTILDEEPVDDLVYQLKLYREFASTARGISRLVSHPYYSFARERIPIVISVEISKDLKVNPNLLEKNFKNIVSGILQQIKLSQQTIKTKIISLKDKIQELLVLIEKNQKLIFNRIIIKKNRAEQTVMFLAVLELIKQKQIKVDQKELFGEIIIKRK